MNDYEIDTLITRYKELNATVRKFEDIARQKVNAINSDLEERLKPIENEQKELELILKEVTSKKEDLKETKTQYKYQSLSGDVVLKKDQLKIKQELDIEDVKKSDFKHFVTLEQKEKLNWADMKRLLIIKDNNIINTETGEIVNIKGLELEEEKGEVIIK